MIGSALADPWLRALGTLPNRWTCAFPSSRGVNEIGFGSREALELNGGLISEVARDGEAGRGRRRRCIADVEEFTFGSQSEIVDQRSVGVDRLSADPRRTPNKIAAFNLWYEATYGSE